MKKLISGLMLFVFALTLTSCIDMNSQTTLSFKELPNAVIQDEDGEGQLDPHEIVVLINGKEYALDAAERIGAIVEGDEYVVGYNTLLVTYNNVTISFTYLVEKALPSVVDTAWYNASQDKFTIETAAELRGLAQLVNDGTADFEGKEVKLGADIDLAGYAWTPIGEAARKDSADNDNTTTAHTFQGTFDGAGYVISGLSDAGYVVSNASKYTTDTNIIVKGYVYGLFGMINGGTEEAPVVIKNVTLEEVQIAGASVVGEQAYVADSVAGILGWSGAGNIEILNCKVAGEIAGFDAVAGIAGRLYYGTYKLENCHNSAEIEGVRVDGGKIAGILGFASTAKEVRVSSCVNKGEITGTAISKGEIYVRQNSEGDVGSKDSKFYYNGVEMMLYTNDGTIKIPGCIYPHTNDELDLTKAEWAESHPAL